jgi:hypothetical protein
MTFPLEYHKGVQRSSSASFPLSGMLVLSLVLAFAVVLSVSSASFAQINGAPPSVTSSGFGGRAVNGTLPSVTSIGRNGFAPHGFAPSNAGGNFHNQFSHDGVHHRHHTVNGDAYYPYVYGLPVPYSVDMDNSDQEDDDSNYQGGPTIFDRRGAGRDSYIPPTYPGPAHSRPAGADSAQADSVQADPPAPETPQPSTVLVFKDGHQVEVGNYAIVGQALYDLTPGRPRKIALADLDLSATQKQNDDRGVSFQLPTSSQAN